MALRLRYGDKNVVLPTGQLFVGRSPDCHIITNDPEVSRRHAVITMGKTGAFVTDLASKAGVRVNGELISGARRLARGDALMIAGLRIVIDEVSVDPDDEPTDPRLRSTIAPPAAPTPTPLRVNPTPPLGIPRLETLQPVHDTTHDAEETATESMTRTQEAPRVVVPPDSGPRSATAPDSAPRSPAVPRTPAAPRSDPEAAARFGRLPPLPPLPSGDTLRALASLGEKALALGRADEAERILLRALLDTLDAVKRAEVDPAMIEIAASLGAKLAGATGAGRWFDYAVALYAARVEVAPAAVVDLLYASVRKAKPIDKALFREYLAALRAAPGDSPARRFLIQRLDGLQRLVDLK